MNVDLSDMLQAREARYARQRQLLRRYPGCLVSFTLNVPGSQKQSDILRTAHKEGMRAMGALFPSESVLYSHTRYTETGDEGYICLSLAGEVVKQMAVSLEEEHPLGRLFDIDVFSPQGASVGRAELGVQPRKCFVCGENAKVCIRNHSHAPHDVKRALETILRKGGMINEQAAVTK